MATAQNWYKAAATNQTAYYGQLAASRIGLADALNFEPMPRPTAAESAAFGQRGCAGGAHAGSAVIVIINGIVATLLGGWMGDRLLRRFYGAYYTFSGIAMLIAVPFMVAAIYVSGRLMFPAIFVAVFLVLVGTGPTNAALVNSVSAHSFHCAGGQRVYHPSAG